MRKTVIALAAACIGLSGAPALALTLNLSTAPAGPLQPGDTVEIALGASTAGDQGIVGANIDVTFQEALLAFDGVVFNPGFSLTPSTFTTDTVNGLTTVSNLTAAIDPIGIDLANPLAPLDPDDPLAGQDLALATLSFTALRPGAGVVTLTGTSGALIIGQSSITGGTFTADETLEADVAVVPVPAAWALLTSGVGLLAAVRRRQI